MHLDQARKWVQTADSIAVLTGAGISAESGVPIETERKYNSSKRQLLQKDKK
jgi:NAD-dependent SIR2 family protein deacetylase